MKSHVSNFLEVATTLLKEVVANCATKVSDRDLKMIRSRIENEGLSFLTITLPNFCADFEKSLAQGYVDSKDFRSFRKSRSIPAFLQGMTNQIFDQETGRILDDVITYPHRYAKLVEGIRQICLAFKKIKLPCTSARTAKAVEGFVQIEQAFNLFPLPKEDDNLFKIVSSVLWDNLMVRLCHDQLFPKHGPGSTAERISGNRKYSWRRWHHRLEPYFPLLGTGYSLSSGQFDVKSEELENVEMVHSDDEDPVRIIAVPKTLKAPRIIGAEPVCMQYVQHAISEVLVKALQEHWFARGQINFSDQKVNQRLALDSSSSGRFATIDLSEASDRVPIGYALYMFSGNPDLKDAIEACRSTKARLPDGRIVHLRKFASMGSALCFPVEAMYFYTLCVVALLKSRDLPVSHSNIKSVSRDVFVYGDDILVPVSDVASVLDHLRKYNCKVNVRKTFLSGNFRESCGMDAFGGEPVKPVYVNTAPPEHRQQVKNIISWVETANLLFEKGLLRTSMLFFSKVERILGELPWVSKESPSLGRNHPWPINPRKRFNRKTQQLEIRCWVTSPVYRTDRLEGYAALQKCLLKLEALTDLMAERDHLHLERSALHGEVAISRRWVPAYINAGRR